MRHSALQALSFFFFIRLGSFGIRTVPQSVFEYLVRCDTFQM